MHDVCKPSDKVIIYKSTDTNIGALQLTSGESLKVVQRISKLASEQTPSGLPPCLLDDNSKSGYGRMHPDSYSNAADDSFDKQRENPASGDTGKATQVCSVDQASEKVKTPAATDGSNNAHTLTACPPEGGRQEPLIDDNPNQLFPDA